MVSSTFQFGKSGDIPVIGDWNGNGNADNGVFRPVTGTWYLDTTKTGVVSSTFQFGKSGDIPEVGDWDGEGTYDAGVFRPVTGTWYLNYHKTGIVDKAFRFGKDGDSPQTGMWFTVTPVPSMPVAAFTNVTPRTGIVPLTVQFADESTSNTRLTYAWDFNNDGVVESTAKNPAYTYAAEGNYTVNLTVTNGAGSDAEVKNNFITVNPVPVAPVAAFTNATPRSGTAPLTVQFTDQSTGTLPLTYAWDFDNNGVTDSTAPSPSHVYSLAGTYTVNLTVTNVAGSNSTVRTNYITVTPPVAPGCSIYQRDTTLRDRPAQCYVHRPVDR